MIRVAALFVILALVIAIATMLRTDADTAIPFSFVGHPALAVGIGLYAYHLLRPVRMSEDERALWSLAFQELRPRDYLRLVVLGQWREAQPGDVLYGAHQQISEVLVLLEGKVAFRVDGRNVGDVGPGQLVGTSVVLTGTDSWGEAVAAEACRYLALPVADVGPALERFPEARAALQGIVSRDLAEKLRTVTQAG
jgi:CRP-like cAMP-binding protein